MKNRYVGRTFIEPTQAMRQLGIRLKLNPLRSVIEGQRLVVIDDSIVRGNTSKKLVQMLRDAGAAEVHLRIVSPEVLWPCFYGIDTDTRDQLIAANMDLGEMNAWIGSDSLAFISLEACAPPCPMRAARGSATHASPATTRWPSPIRWPRRAYSRRRISKRLTAKARPTRRALARDSSMTGGTAPTWTIRHKEQR